MGNTGEWRVDDTTPQDRPTYVRWLVSGWCNFTCTYCAQNHDREQKFYDWKQVRSLSDLKWFRKMKDRISGHAFDNAPPAAWIEAFERLPGQELSMLITGGEPFLDKRNFSQTLIGLTNLEKVRIVRIDTNGSWTCKAYAEVDWSKVRLNLSFHPTMVGLDDFKKRAQEKLDHDVPIGMVNFVLEPGQADQYPAVRDELGAMGLFVNPNVYFGPLQQTAEGLELYERFIPEFDLNLKARGEKTQGQSCYYPSVAYHVDPVGAVWLPCVGTDRMDFLAGEIPERRQGAVPCPVSNCSCLDMYAFLEKSDRGKRLNLLDEYVEIMQAFHHEQVGHELADGSEEERLSGSLQG